LVFILVYEVQTSLCRQAGSLQEILHELFILPAADLLLPSPPAPAADLALQVVEDGEVLHSVDGDVT